MTMTPADELVELQWRLRQLQQQLRGPTHEEAAALRQAEARADAALGMHGERAGSPALGEGPLDFRRRLLRKAAQFSPKFRSTSLTGLAGQVLNTMEDRVYDDVRDAAFARADAAQGVLVPFEERDSVGRVVTKFRGDIGSFLDPFKADGARCKLKET